MNGEIISADSRQVYRDLDAGTAKPSRDMRKAVAHHLINCADPREPYDAARFVREAKQAIGDIRSRGKIPLIVGGTGLYLRALLSGLSPLPERNPEIRSRLKHHADSHGVESLHSQLSKVDPEAAATIDPKNIHRLIRALEVFELTGTPLTVHWSHGRRDAMKASAILRLEISKDVLNERITARTRGFWPDLLREVQELVPTRYSGMEPGFTSLGYRQALAVNRGEMNAEAGLEDLIRSTHAYAKRQRTWFRHQLPSIPIEPATKIEQTVKQCLIALEARHEKTIA
jgi:tRNA dimethylallyltransferase